ncbi:phage major capsid protein [Agromyces atrinae]|uniref:HK97 family phage prohead protease n=1 Tax=Agromyces atrinae TaxID=592376 RepID=A0A4Q2M8K2_9MICO|nr:hypothetical protein [Agromyces atrinae]NYD65989.1 hypothetical protein [Agromyces atrinae]RXZ86321.1 hypothetical protein ESP50_11225 [Agromyces atrinae]
MTTVQMDAGTLEFSSDDMTATGLLVPFGEEARTNLGRFTADENSFTFPTDVTGLALNTDHKREQPVGAFTKIWKQPEGLFASYKFSESDEGKAAYADAKAGKKSNLSVEAAGVIIRAGKAVAGRIFASALVASPAFPSATLLAAAVDTEEEPPADAPTETEEVIESEFTDEDGVTHVRKTTRTTRVDGDKTTITEVIEITEPEPQEEEEDAMSLPGTLTANKTDKAAITVREIGAMLYASKNGQLALSEIEARLKDANVSQDTLFAALSDVKFDGTGGLASKLGVVPQWLGEVWQATKFRQQVLPLFSHGDLTALTFAGFKWGTKPTGGDWAGNKADVPSNTLVVTPTSGSAARYALGHDIAREFVDFPVPGFFESYAAAVSEDYARWADNKVAAAIIAGATTLAGDALTTLPGGASGNIGSAASAIVDGATAIVTTGSLPSFALVAPALWKQLAKTPHSNVLGYLSASLGLAEGDLDSFIIRPSSAVAAGKVLV